MHHAMSRSPVISLFSPLPLRTNVEQTAKVTSRRSRAERHAAGTQTSADFAIMPLELVGRVGLAVHVPKVELGAGGVLRHQPRVEQRLELGLIPVDRTRPGRVVPVAENGKAAGRAAGRAGVRAGEGTGFSSA